METYWFLCGVAATLLVETVLLKIMATWMAIEIRKDHENNVKP